jgi:hypothetical protein
MRVMFILFCQLVTISDKSGFLWLLDDLCAVPENGESRLSIPRFWKMHHILLVQLDKFPTFYSTRSFITVDNNLPCVPILCQINPACTFPSYLHKIHFTIILPSMTRSSKRTLSCRSCHQSPVFFLLCALHPTHLILLYLISITVCGDNNSHNNKKKDFNESWVS